MIKLKDLEEYKDFYQETYGRDPDELDMILEELLQKLTTDARDYPKYHAQARNRLIKWKENTKTRLLRPDLGRGAMNTELLEKIEDLVCYESCCVDPNTGKAIQKEQILSLFEQEINKARVEELRELLQHGVESNYSAEEYDNAIKDRLKALKPKNGGNK